MDEIPEKREISKTKEDFTDGKEKNPIYEEKISPSQEQVHSIVFSREIGWQEIIYDLINSEQLDPWNVDIIILTNNYMKKLQQYEEDNYFISSKVLLAAALLLRIKSEILLNKYIRSIDEILFGKKEKKPVNFERIELEDYIPELIPKSPLPRFRKVTIKELVESLNKAIITENRRIHKEIIGRNAIREASFSLPKRKYLIKDKIKEIYGALFGHFDNGSEKMLFSELINGNTNEEKIIYFSSILHLENQKKIWLEQKEHFGEILIWEKENYFKNNNPFADLKDANEEETSEKDWKAAEGESEEEMKEG